MALGTFSGSGLGFGVTFTLRDQFTNVANKINSKFDQLALNTDRLSDRINHSFGKIASGIGLVTVGLGLLAPLGMGIGLASDFEATNIAFSTMLGSAEEAKKVLAEVDDVAGKTPFSIKEVEEGYKRLMAFGVQTKDLKSDFKAIGNITAGVGADITLMIRNYGQIRGKGYLTGRDRLDFVNQGFDIIGALRANGTQVDLSKDIAGQRISFEKVRDAIRAAGNEGGKFANLMDKLSTTVKGMTSNIEDNATRAMRKVGQALEFVVKPVLRLILKLLDKFIPFSKTVMGQWSIRVVAAGLALVALGVIVVGLKLIFVALGNAVRGSLSSKSLNVRPVARLGAQILILYNLLNSTNSLLFTTGLALMVLFGPVGMISGVVFMLGRAWGAFNDVMKGSVEPAGGILGVFQKIGGLLQAIVAVFKTADGEGFMMLEDLESNLKNLDVFDLYLSISTWVVRLKNFFRGLKEGFMEVWEGIQNFIDSFKEVTGKVIVWENSIDKNKTTMESWKDAGVQAAQAIAFVLGLIILKLTIMTIKFLIAGVTAVMSFFLVILVVVAIIAVISGVIWAMENWGELSTKVRMQIVAAIGVVIIALIILTFKYIIAGVAAIIAFFPIIAIIFLIALAIFIVIAIIQNWDEIVQWLGDSWDYVKEKVIAWWDYMLEFPGKAWDWGVQLVKSIWGGIKSIWVNLDTWLSDKLGVIWDLIKAPYKAIGNVIGGVWDAVTGNGDDAGNTKGNPEDFNAYNPINNQPSYIGEGIARYGANQFTQPTPVVNTTVNPAQPIPLKGSVTLDGDKVGDFYIEQEQKKDARSGY